MTFLLSALYAGAGAGPLAHDNELGPVSALTEQSWVWMGWIHLPQILGDSEKGHQRCQKSAV